MIRDEVAWRELKEASRHLSAKEISLLDELQGSALAYAYARGAWLMADAAERPDMEASRSRIHDRFINSCNALSRACGKSGLPQEWRAVWGDARTGEARRRIGDFACYIAFQLTLEAR